MTNAQAEVEALRRRLHSLVAAMLAVCDGCFAASRAAIARAEFVPAEMRGEILAALDRQHAALDAELKPTREQIDRTAAALAAEQSKGK